MTAWVLVQLLIDKSMSRPHSPKMLPVAVSCMALVSLHDWSAVRAVACRTSTVFDPLQRNLHHWSIL